MFAAAPVRSFVDELRASEVSDRSRRAGTAACAVVALSTRLFYWFTTRDRIEIKDSATYHELATNLANGHGFAHTYPQIELHPTAFRPPVYPFFLSLVYRVTGPNEGAGRALSVVLGVAVVLLTLWVLHRHAGFVAGLAAAFIVAIYPPLIANDTMTLSENLSLILILLLVDRSLLRHWAVAGLLTGLLLLTRPSAQLVVIVIIGWFLIKAGKKAALGFLAVTLLVVSPWVLRNAMAVGSATIVTSNGFNVAAIYSPTAEQRGGFIDPVDDPDFEDLRFDKFDEASWDRKLLERGVDNLRRNPFQVAHVVRTNTMGFLELTPSLNDWPERVDGRNMTIRRVGLPLFYLVTTAGLIGLWRARKTDLVQFVAVVGLCFTLGSLLLVAPPRLRGPFDLMCCIGSGLLVAELLSRAGRDQPDAESTRQSPTLDLATAASSAAE